MRILSGNTLLDECHDDVLGRHERQLGVNTLLDDGGVYNEAGGDVVEEDERGIGAEEGLWETHAADGAVVEGALHPLRGICGSCVGAEIAQFAA